jgi:hypothetical protein
MKRLFKLFVVFVALGSVVTGCKKDDADSSLKNYFKIGDTQYELSAGAILGWEETMAKGVFDVELKLYSSGITMTSAIKATGKSNALCFQTYSSQLNDLPDGSYSYGLESNQKAGVFWAADALINFDASTDNSEKDIAFKTGTVTISKSGTDYTITIAGTSASGETITGYYKGTLTKY